MRTTTINKRMILQIVAVGLVLASALALGSNRRVQRSEVETQATVDGAGVAHINAATGVVPPIEIQIDGVEVPVEPNAVSHVETKSGSATVVNGSTPNSSSTVVTSSQPQSNGNVNLSITTNESNSNTSVQTSSNSSNSSFVSTQSNTHVFTTGNGAVNVTH